MKGILAAFIVLLLAGLGHATYLRNFAWKTEQTLWADAAMKAPDQFRPHHNLGVVYQQQGRLQEAVAEFEKALESRGVNRRTEKVGTYYHLGRAYQQLGDLQKAKAFHPVTIETPLMWLDKAATWQLAHQLGGDALVQLIREETNSSTSASAASCSSGAGAAACARACGLRASGRQAWQATPAVPAHG